MKDFNTRTYALNFSGFSIEVNVNMKLSVDFTNRFNHHGPDFVFAVVEIWLNQTGVKHLILPAIRPGNFLEELKELKKFISNPPSILGIEELISCGGWGSWMVGYWDRIDKECSTVEDEKLYDLLIPASYDASKVGDIAVYMYGGKKIFEVAVRPGEGREAAGTWTEFRSDDLVNQIAHLENVIASDIRGALEPRETR